MLQQTSTIPVIFVIVADPVGSGFVKSLAHPGGNATGFTIMEPTIVSKWLELLKEIAPNVTHAALLFNPATTPYADIYVSPFKTAAPSFGLEATTRCYRLTRSTSRIWFQCTAIYPNRTRLLASHCRLPGRGASRT